MVTEAEVFNTEIFHKADQEWRGCWLPVEIKSVNSKQIIIIGDNNDFRLEVDTSCIINWKYWPELNSVISANYDHIRPVTLLPEQTPTKQELLNARFFEVRLPGQIRKIEGAEVTWVDSMDFYWRPAVGRARVSTKDDEVAIVWVADFFGKSYREDI